MLHVFETVTGNRAATLPLGTSPWKLFVDTATNSVAVLGYAEDGFHGRLYEFRGKNLVGKVELGECPQDLMRVADLPGRLVVAYDEIRFIPDQPDAAGFSVRLNTPDGAGKNAERDHARSLEAWPTEVHYAPDARVFVMGLIDHGWLPPSRSYPKGLMRLAKDEVAVANVTTKDVASKLKLGRGSVRFSKGMKSAAIGFAFALATGAVGYGLGFLYVVNMYPTDPLGRRAISGNDKIVISRDGRYAYGLDTPTDDITIIRLDDGMIIDRVDVGGGCTHISLGPGGRFVYGYTDDQITLIDTKTNKVQLNHHVTDAKINLVMQDAENQLLFVLTTKAVLVIDTSEGRLLGAIDGVTNPKLVVFPDEHDALVPSDVK